MDLKICNDGFEKSKAVAIHARERIWSALDKHIKHVRSVAMTTRDVNGPKGGNDKLCMLKVYLDFRSKPVIVKKLHGDIYNAVSDAADTVKRTVGRLVSRLKEHR